MNTLVLDQNKLNEVIVSYCHIDRLYAISYKGQDIHHQSVKPSTDDIIYALRSDDWAQVFKEMKEGETRVSDRIYYDMLGCVPPVFMNGDYFIMGECVTANLYYHFYTRHGFRYGQLLPLNSSSKPA